MVIKGKTMWLLLGTFLLGYSFNLLMENAGVKEAMANTGSKCDYTSLSYPGYPLISEYGKIDYSLEFEKLLNNGWRLHLMEGEMYIFEKCN